jgi:very-short-patch-repair endonuclease
MFKPAAVDANKIYLRAERTDSPIENEMLRYLLRYNAVLCRPGDEPVGSGVFITTQYPVGPYRADFMIIARGYKSSPRIWPPTEEHKLCVECDGEQFHTSEEDVARDKKRDEYFKEQVIEVLRLTGTQIYKNGDKWAEHIFAHLRYMAGVL